MLYNSKFFKNNLFYNVCREVIPYLLGVHEN